MGRQVEYVEWRSPRDALAMDFLLLSSVFARLRRTRAGDQVDLTYFSKQQVLDELVAHEDGKLLRMRPNLRAFHTRLASLSNIQESASLNMFRITRVRDPTISQTMACDLLTKLITPAILLADAAEARRQHPYKSQWCVFDAKLRSKSPASDYKVCEPRPRALTPAEKRRQEQVQRWTLEAARVLAHNVVAAVLTTSVRALLPLSRKRTLASRKSNQTETDFPSVVALTADEGSSKPTRRLHPRRKPSSSSLVAEKAAQRLSDLRLQVLCPGFAPDTSVLSGARPIEAFIALVESAGHHEAASRLLSHYKFETAVHAIANEFMVAHPSATALDGYLPSYFAWAADARSRTLKQLR